MIVDYCPICVRRVLHDVLKSKTPQLPDFAICTKCGNGFSIEPEDETA